MGRILLDGMRMIVPKKVLSLIIHSEHQKQPGVVKIKPKWKDPQIGDEEIHLCPGIGDAYEMVDCNMQTNYVHSLPKVLSKHESGCRFALIFF